MSAEKSLSPLFLTATIICLITLCSSESRIHTGEIISASQNINTANWKSSSGNFAFGFYKEDTNFRIGIQYFSLNSNFTTVIWTADRNLPLIPADATLTFTHEGILLHFDDTDRTIYDLCDHNNFQLDSASMLDSGNFVLYDKKNHTVCESFSHPSDTLMPTQIIKPGQILISSVSNSNHSSGRFKFVSQNENGNGNGIGNAGLYPVNTLTTSTNAYWNFIGNYTNLLNFSSNSSQDLGLVRFLRIDPDGYLRIYSIEQSGLMKVFEQYPPGEQKCDIKGICGLNSYCKYTTLAEVFCFCFPGYVYIDPTREFLGCQRNFSITNSNNSFYEIHRLPNVIWSDDSYSSLQVQSENECKNLCADDCDCPAAIFYFSTNRCSKQKLPFMYGKVLFGLNESTVAFFKVPNSDLNNSPNIVAIRMLMLDELGKLPLFLSMSITAIIAVMLNFLIFFLFKNRIRMYRRLYESMEPILEKTMAPQFFSYKKIEQATNSFKEEIGKGQYGKVFKGLLPQPDANFLPVAVKKLTNVPTKVEENFRNELKSTGRIHHRNIVRLLGFCHEGSDWILVYEYMRFGSLADLIFNSKNVPLNWKQRVSIAMDVARGICYLHEGCENAIIHGDIKPENILIGDGNIAKIGDLGLAKHLRADKRVTYTRERGTLKYMAPEWKNGNGCVSTKVDVVSFGVLLLELIFLKEFQQEKGLDEEYNLASWAYKCLEGKCKWKFVGEDVDVVELEEIVKIALWCFPKLLSERLSMYDVVMMLGRKKGVGFPPVPLVDWYIPTECRAKEKE